MTRSSDPIPVSAQAGVRQDVPRIGSGCGHSGVIDPMANEDGWGRMSAFAMKGNHGGDRRLPQGRGLDFLPRFRAAAGVRGRAGSGATLAIGAWAGLPARRAETGMG
jgi:hypothetical protein